MTRMSHTGRDMEASGTWVKLGRKHYEHVSGVQVRYNHNRWVWEIVGHDEAYTMLWPARHRAEQIGLASMPAWGVQ